MRPHPASSIIGRHAVVMRTAEKKLSSKPCCQSVAVSFCSRVGVPPPPVLLTRMSSRPSSSTARCDDQWRRVGVEQVGDDLHDAYAVRGGFVRSRLQRRLGAGVQHHVRALAREVERDLAADAAARAGDDRDTVAQPELHQPSVATRSA